jgi:hypothetical protein
MSREKLRMLSPIVIASFMIQANIPLVWWAFTFQRIKGEADAGDGTARKASRRAERYAVRCDKLEVDPLGPSDAGGT